MIWGDVTIPLTVTDQVAPHGSCSTNVNSENIVSSKRSMVVKSCSLEEAISVYFQTEWVFLCQLFFNSVGNNFRSFNLDKCFFLYKPQYFALLGADVYSSFSELAIEPLSVCMNFVYKNSEIGNKAIKQFRFIVS